MSDTNLHDLSPGVLSLLPLFYIGWSDSVLSPSEIKLIHFKINDLSFLTEEDKAYLIKFTNPVNLPDEAIFREWLEALKYEASKLAPGVKESLAQLGIDIANVSIHNTKQTELDYKESYQSLLEIEKELGVYTEEDLKSMIHQLDAHHLTTNPKSSSFDSLLMQKIFDGQYFGLKKTMKTLLQDNYFALENIRDKHIHRLRTLEQLKELARRGYGLMAYPIEYGGQGDMGKYIAMFEVLASHDMSLTVKFGVQFGLFGGTIYGLGTTKHHSKYLEDAGKAKLLGCFAMTETGHGSNVKDLETIATYSHEDQTLCIHTPHHNAGKEYIGNALHGSIAVVFAQLIINGENHGIHAIVVPYRDKHGNTLPGIEVKDNGYKLGLNGVDNGRLWFDNVKVPKENLLNRFGDIDASGNYQSTISNSSKRFFTMLGALVGGRICVGLGSLSAAKTAVTIATKYALKRRQFSPKDGEPESLIMDYPIHQQRLLPSIVKIYCYHNSLSLLAAQYQIANEEEMRKIETKAAGLKAMATWLATSTIQQCREACGGKGYLWENRFADLKADSDIFTTFEGDNFVLFQLVAKGILTEFKQNFHDGGFKAVMRYLGNKFDITLSEINPYFTHNTSIAHLTSEDFHSDALRYREKKLLLSVSDRMRKYLKKRFSPYEAYLKCQTHMIELARAYVERLAYRDMMKKVSNLNESKEKEMLKKIAAFYALTTIQENKGWYLENDYMDGSKTKAIRRILHKMLQELRPDAEALVDAFGISEASLDAEILRSN